MLISPYLSCSGVRFDILVFGGIKMAKYSSIYDSKIEDNTDKRAIAIYGRVSTREQAEYGFSVRDQRDKCEYFYRNQYLLTLS